MTEIEILNKSFIFYEDDSMWLTSLNEISDDATFEIYNKELNVPLVTKILKFLNGEKYISLEVKSKNLLSNLSTQFWGDDLFCPIFYFTGITIFDFQRDVDFQVLFQMSSDHKGFGSDYANWRVDVKDFKIIGAFREQL